MRLYTYILTLCYDKGNYTVQVNARNKTQAISYACLVENCPKRAIIKIIRK